MYKVLFAKVMIIVIDVQSFTVTKTAKIYIKLFYLSDGMVKINYVTNALYGSFRAIIR